MVRNASAEGKPQGAGARPSAPASSGSAQPTQRMHQKSGTPVETLRIEGFAHDGRGVARRNGKAVFVDGALPGEEVNVRVRRQRSSHDEAELLGIISPSPDRMPPPCPHAGRCGGCALQHLATAAQLAAQHQRLADALSRIGKLAPEHWLPPEASASWGYRSRARLSIARESVGGRVSVGFLQEESTRVETIDACGVLVPALAALPGLLRDVVASLEGPVIPREAWLAAGDDSAAIAFCSTGKLAPADRERLLAFGASRNLQIGFGTRVGQRERRWESPAPRLEYSPGEGIRLCHAPWDFTQANPVINRLLVSRVLALLAPGPDEAVLDFFCGIGNFSLPLARYAKKVLALESSATQVATATANAEANGIGNCAFRESDLFDEASLRELPRKEYPLAVLDPPRAGAALLCQNLRALGVRRLVYVSCDTATLARDAKHLHAQGYRLKSAGVFQMFPHTAHVESLALFQR